MSFLVIRARSDRGVTRKIRETMAMLNLTRVNHATIVMDNPSYRGMLQKAKDYITWGEADAALVERMLAERGRMAGNSPLTDAIVAEHTDYKNISEFAKAIVAGDAQVKDIPNLKRVFRLHPPRGTKGWGGLKRSFVVGGALGSRGEEIGALVERMI
mgnify:CR=1 FL=1